MFGRKKPAASKPSGASGGDDKFDDADLMALGLDPAAFGDDGVDINDADLLSELDALTGGGSGSPGAGSGGGGGGGGGGGADDSLAGSAAKRKSFGALDMSGLASIDALPELDEDDQLDVELTEDDMHDPELLAGLSELTGESVAEAARAVAPAAKNEVLPTPEFIKDLKVQAVVARRAGDQAKAVQLLRQAQAAESRLAAVAAPAPAPSKPVAPTPAPPSPQQEAQRSMMALAESQLPRVEERILLFKQAALRARANGDMDAAQQYVKMIKAMERLAAKCRSGTPIDLQQLPAPPVVRAKLVRSASSKRLLKAKSGASQGTAAAGKHTRQLSSSETQTYAKLETLLRHQVKRFLDRAKDLQASEDKVTAVKVFRQKQQMMDDLAKLIKCRDLKLPVPKHHLETWPVPPKQINPHLTPRELEINVVRASGLVLDGVDVTKLRTYVVVSFPYPTSGSPTVLQSNLTTGANPEYAFAAKVAVDPAKLLRSLLVKIKSNTDKMAVEVYHRSAGVLRDGKPRLVGRATMRTGELVQQCDVEASLDLTQERRLKLSGAKLDVVLRLRSPLNGKPVVSSSTERVLVFDAFPLSESEDPSKPAAAAAATAAAPVHTSEEAATAQAAPSSSGRGKGKGRRRSSSGGGMVEDPHDVDRIVSNDVLEWEVSRLNTLLAGTHDKAKQQELTDRKEQVELKMQLLVMQVTSGELTMPAYLQRLRGAITADKMAAVMLNRDGDKPGAKLMLSRVKIMEAEIAGAEAAAEDDGGDE